MAFNFKLNRLWCHCFAGFSFRLFCFYKESSNIMTIWVDLSPCQSLYVCMCKLYSHLYTSITSWKHCIWEVNGTTKSIKIPELCNVAKMADVCLWTRNNSICPEAPLSNGFISAQTPPEDGPFLQVVSKSPISSIFFMLHGDKNWARTLRASGKTTQYCQ